MKCERKKPIDARHEEKKKQNREQMRKYLMGI